MGNAICLVSDGGAPLLVTDPWLVGTAYFGSWAHDKPLTEAQIAACKAAPYAWFSHGHPDHLHPDSVRLLSRDTVILLGDHYCSELRDFFLGEGFHDVRVCRDKQWLRLSEKVRVLSVCNINQDTILAIEAGDTLILNQNDSPFFGEDPFFRRLVRNYDKSYLLALCAIDADMINFVDEAGRSVAGPPDARKMGSIWVVSERCDYLGVKNFCCSSSQHVYVRADSVWANPYRIDWGDMQKHWISKSARLIEPYVTVDLDSGRVTANHPSHETDFSQVSDRTGDDDWDEPMTAPDWAALEAFVMKFETLRPKVDFLEFSVAGEARRFYLSARGRAKAPGRQRGLVFQAPRRSLMETVEYGYFDDLLIGNFMKTRLVNMSMYPDFSPRIAKYGGNAKVFTLAEFARFRWHYFKRSPSAMIRLAVQSRWNNDILPAVKLLLAKIGVFEMVKQIYRRRATASS
jgi:hypothetical protein